MSSGEHQLNGETEIQTSTKGKHTKLILGIDSRIPEDSPVEPETVADVLVTGISRDYLKRKFDTESLSYNFLDQVYDKLSDETPDLPGQIKGDVIAGLMTGRDQDQTVEEIRERRDYEANNLENFVEWVYEHDFSETIPVLSDEVTTRVATSVKLGLLPEEITEDLDEVGYGGDFLSELVEKVYDHEFSETVPELSNEITNKAASGLELGLSPEKIGKKLEPEYGENLSSELAGRLNEQEYDQKTDVSTLVEDKADDIYEELKKGKNAIDAYEEEFGSRPNSDQLDRDQLIRDIAELEKLQEKLEH